MICINNDFLIVKDEEKDENYIINKKNEEKEYINKDMFTLLKYIHESENLEEFYIQEFDIIIKELMMKKILVEKQ